LLPKLPAIINAVGPSQKLTFGEVVRPGKWRDAANLINRPVNKSLSPFAIVESPAATFEAGQEAWYKVGVPASRRGDTTPVQGVLFRAQLYFAEQSRVTHDDELDLNYSVDGKACALPADQNMLHALRVNLLTRAYYDASNDRNWTWGDLANLNVRLRAAERGAKPSVVKLTAFEVWVRN
jgi:hypothetical protein